MQQATHVYEIILGDTIIFLNVSFLLYFHSFFGSFYFSFWLELIFENNFTNIIWVLLHKNLL